jgi:hypothetical protein
MAQGGAVVITRLIWSLTQGGVCLAGKESPWLLIPVGNWDDRLSELLQNWDKCGLEERATILAFITSRFGHHIETLVNGVHTVKSVEPSLACGVYTMGQ